MCRRIGAPANAREGKLAETAPNRPLALTIGAAAVTLLVVIGVLTGPSVVNCFNAPDGMGACLRDRLADARLVPATAPAPDEEAATAVAEPAPDADAPAGEVPEDLIAATFGLLRAEPDGSLVIAGSGTPGSQIEVYSNGELIGRAVVEPSGDWVLVPDAPVPPGGSEITLAEAGKLGRAEQSFVVVIDPDRTSQPLVVASRPGEATEILQGLERPAVEEATQVADVPEEAVAEPETEAGPDEPAVAGEAVTQEPAATEAQASATTDTEVAAPANIAETEVAQPDAAASPATPATTSDALQAAEAETAVAAVADKPAATETETPAAVAPGPAEPEPATTEPADTPTQEAVAVVAPPETAPPETALSGQAQPEGAVPALELPPTIDAIEIDGERTFFAGAGPEGATMRLYVDDTFIADALVEGGRWLVEAGAILPGPQHAIRIDMLAPGSADVASRAEVNFVVDLPEADEPVAVAEAEAPAATDAEAATDAVVPAEQAAAEPATGEPAAQTPEMSQPAVAEPATQTAETEDVQTLVAEPVGDPELQRFASGRAIIRRGDNLWTIARRVYGEGIKYTTIYQANAAQIRDPDRIYPGQVFDLPTQ